MRAWQPGLRTKAILALLVASFLALVPAVMIGTQVLGSVQDHFGRAFARNLTDLSRQRVLAPVLQDLALARRFTGSILVTEFLTDETDPAKRERFFAEAQGYAEDFRGGAYFVASALTNHYYFNEVGTPRNDEPSYILDPANPDDDWFYTLLDSIGDHNINVNPDVQLGTTRVWLNLPIRLNGQTIGLAGTGLDLTQFIADFIESDEPGVTPMLLNHDGAFQAHPDTDRIAYGVTAGQSMAGRTLYAELPDSLDQEVLSNAMAASVAEPDNVQLVEVFLDGRPQLLALAYLPELEWYLATAVDLSVAQVIGGTWWVTILGGLGLMLVVLLMFILIAVDRILIRPLDALKGSVAQIAQGNFDVRLPPGRADEIGELSQAFSTMAQKIRNNTRELEAKVQARTQDLEDSNREIAQVNRMVRDSIEYASLIQQAILPNPVMQKHLPQHFVLWQPKDVVGGDFYFFHAAGDELLLGVVDCAGHGVPGALMTMLARAAFDNAIRESGLSSPAQVLRQTDSLVRNMLQELDLPRALATNMDAGLITVNTRTRTLRYAGAKVSLFVMDTGDVTEIKGQRRPLVGRRPGDYVDTSLELEPNVGYYMTTDGLLDQPGGELGFGLGASGFKHALEALKARPITEQGFALQAHWQNFSGDRPQRDDICVLGVRFPL